MLILQLDIEWGTPPTDKNRHVACDDFLQNCAHKITSNSLDGNQASIKMGGILILYRWREAILAAIS